MGIIHLTQFRMGGEGQKAPILTSSPPVTSTDVGVSHQNFLTFSFNPFATLVRNFKAIPSASSKLLNFHQNHPSKRVVF